MTSRFPFLQRHKTRSEGRVFFMIRMLTSGTVIESFRAKRSGLPARSMQQNLGDSCGCAMGARFLAVALTASTAWYGWCWYSSRLCIGGAFLHMMMWAFIAACVRKKNFFCGDLALLPDTHAVAGNAITSACFVATGANVTRCA